MAAGASSKPVPGIWSGRTIPAAVSGAYLEDGGSQHLRFDENTVLFRAIAMLAVGGLITLSSYVSNAPGNSYLVTSGLLVVGAINLTRGLYNHLKDDSSA